MQTELFHKLSPEKQAAIVSAGTEEFSKKSFADANTDVITQACGKIGRASCRERV